jgi:hypothetical protein
MENFVTKSGEVLVLDPSSINVIVGRNGAGKSRFLRRLVAELRNQPVFAVSYISPERAGSFKYDPGEDSRNRSNVGYLVSSREKNHSEYFKMASASRLRQLEIVFLRQLSTDLELRNSDRTFQSEYLDKINALLLNVSISQSRKSEDFIFTGFTGNIISPEHLSSGESEAISLATEIMYFFSTLTDEKRNVLALDEPDVHMHPDMQARLAKFIVSQMDEHAAKGEDASLVISTHSTPLICALCASPNTSLGVKAFGSELVKMVIADDNLRKIGPFFAHPLSRSITDDPILIIEGEDDERVWQQASRSSNGNIRLFPCLADTVSEQTELEEFCAKMLTAIYDRPVGYSLRDGDGKTGSLNAIGPIQRYRLNCYAIENVLLTDEALASMDATWEAFQEKAHSWVSDHETHKYAKLLKEIANSADRFQHKKIKDARNLICAVLDVKKPWEVVVGQTIGALAGTPSEQSLNPHGIRSYIGVDFLGAVLDVT